MKTLLKNWKIYSILLLQISIAFLILPMMSFTDSDEYLLGGCLIAHNKHIYTDFFTNHGPLTYYLISFLYRLVGSCPFLLPRYLLYGATIASLWLVYRYSKSYITLISTNLFIAFASFYYQTLTPLSETFMTLAVINSYILIQFYKKIKAPAFWIIFSISQSFFIGLNPLYSPAALVVLLYFLFKKRRSWLKLIGATLLPSGILLGFINLVDFYNAYFVFNIQYFTSSTQLLNQYGNYIVVQLNAVYTLFTQFRWHRADKYLVLTELASLLGFIQLVYWLYKKKLLDGSILLTYVGLMLVLLLRVGGFHMYPALMLALLLLGQFAPKRKINIVFITLIILFTIRLFAGAWWFNIRNVSEKKRLHFIKKVITHYSNQKDSLLYYPFRPEIYLLTKRLPQSFYPSFSPWDAKKPGTEERVIYDIKHTLPKIIFFENDRIINEVSTRTYMKKTQNYLENNPSYKKLKTKEAGLTIFIRK